MNKIYKVVWSKAKHCYVVVSELAKQNTKGCGARNLRMAAVSLGVAAALLGGFSTTAEAKSVSKVIIDYSGYYVFQHSPKSLTVNQEAIDNVDSWTGNTYAYGNVRRGDSRAVTDVYYTIEDGESVRHSDINIYYGNPADPQSYFPVLTQNPFNDTTVIENNAIQYGTYSTIGEFAKADPDAKKEVTGYSLTLTGTGLNEAAGALSYGGNVNNNAITVDGGSANTVYGGVTTKGEATNNAVTVNSGTVDRLYGGKSSGIYESVDGKANDNTVIINNGTVKEVNGGAVTYGSANTNHVYMNNGAVNYLIGGDGGKSANYNEVIISGGAVNKSTGKDEAIIGGRVASTEAKGNTVTIKGDAKVTGDVLGASSWYGDAVITDNTVTIKGNAVVTGNVTGALGLDNYDKKKNTVNIEENAQVTGNVYGGRISKQGYWEPYDGNADTNAVNIKGGTVTGNVYGGSVEESSTRGAINNTVTIDGGTVSSTVYGGYSYNGEATGNMVTMTAGQVNSSVYGGVSETKAASSNNVKVSGGKVSGGVIGGRSGKDYGDGHPAVEDVKNNTVEISGDAEVTSAVYGGRITNATANVEDNTVTIKDSSKVNRGIHGGQTNYGNAIHNKVTIEGGTITGQSYGDYVTGGRVSSDSNGKAQNNEVEISGGTVSITVQGGFAQGGETTGNKVTISGGTVTATVEGAYNTGDVRNNSVTITGGKLSNLVSGGRGSGSATGNTVAISGGTDSWIIIGGNGMRGATGNTVTISGGDLTVTQDRARPIYGGYTDFYDDSPRDATGNTVNLTGNTTGLETRNIVGGYICNEGSGDVVSGNELHVGGTKDGSITGTWTGSSNNKVNKVANFETIAYHSVKWDTSVAALEATTVENVGAIDINNLAFAGAASSGTMALLKSGSDLSAIKLNYSGGTGATITTEGVTFNGGSGGEQTETDGVNGVKLTALGGREKVWLATDSKAINYEKLLGNVTKISFGKMTWGTGRTADAGTSFAGVTDDTIDTTNLQFSNPEAASPNATMKLLSGAENLAAGTNRDHVQTFDYELDNTVSLNATLSGTVVRTTANEIGYQAVGTAVNSVDLAGWDGTAVDVSEATAGWTLGTGATITTGDLADAGLDTMNPGDVKTIVTAGNTVTFTNDMISGSKAWQDGGTIDDSADTSGVSVAGTTTGGGVKVDDTNAYQLVYQKDKKDVATITLGSVAYTKGETVRKFDSTYDLATATINAEAFSITNPTATMNAGDTMVVVDATNAIKADGEATKTLKDFETKTMTPIDFSDDISGTVLTFAGKHTDTLEQNEAKTQIVYKVGDKNVEAVTLDGSVTWDDSKAYYTNDATKYKFATTNVDADKLTVTGTTTKLLKADGTSSMTLLSATGMTAGTFTDQSEANKAASKVSVNYKDDKGVAFKAEAKGEVKAEAAAVKYNINEVKLTDVDLSGWTGSESSVPDTWTAEGGSVKVATGSFAEPDVAIGSARTILTAGSAFFADANISGANKYDEANGKAFSETQNNVTVSGTQAKGVAASEDSKSLVYKVDIKKADTVSLGATNWQKDATLFDGSSADYNYANVTAVDAGKFDVTYAAPETVAAGESMTLLKANETLTAIVNEEKSKAYRFTPVSGVTVDAAITGKLAVSNNAVTFTPSANQASKLTFGDVEWKDSGALLTRPSNITFAGADVDTSKINFTNMIYLDADRQMTLVSDFGDKVGTITGSKYLVGTAFEGEGAASLSGSDLVFRTKTGAGVSEQTHKTVMATEVGVTMLNTGNDYIDKAMEGMGDLANVAPDGTTVGAAIGGGRNRYETGSHVNVNSWNAAVAVGAKRELKNGSLEYGVFGEYGKANFTLHSDAGKGDGDSHYAGGGLLAKWTNKHDVYTEASFRLGRLNESSNDIMRDGLGNTYGYDVHANYFGAHVGVGKIFRYKGGKSLDVYGKYFYTKRDGVEFDAVQHYNLDSVSSSVLRVGARYGTTDKKWNWYGGLAYEYEFDGEATGTVKDKAIRAASIKGSSVRGEIGMRMNATKTNPWQMDISLYGYGGKHRGIGGNVNVAYMF